MFRYLAGKSYSPLFKMTQNHRAKRTFFLGSGFICGAMLIDALRRARTGQMHLSNFDGSIEADDSISSQFANLTANEKLGILYKKDATPQELLLKKMVNHEILQRRAELDKYFTQNRLWIFKTMNCIMLADNIYITQEHFDSLKLKNPTTWELLKSENPHVLNSQGTNWVYFMGKTFHKLIVQNLKNPSEKQ